MLLIINYYFQLTKIIYFLTPCKKGKKNQMEIRYYLSSSRLNLCDNYGQYTQYFDLVR